MIKITQWSKLINQLDSLTRVFVLGGDHCLLSQIGQVYTKFQYKEHGANARGLEYGIQTKLGINSKNLPREGPKFLGQP